MKILIHSPRLSYYTGGGERVPLEQAEALSMLGHEITLLTWQVKNYSPIFSDFLSRNSSKINIEYVNMSKKQRVALFNRPHFDWLRWHTEAVLFGQIVQQYYLDNLNNIDIVATHLTSDSLFVPLSLPNVLHLHGTPNRLDQITQISLLRPDLFCADALNIKSFWKKVLHGKEVYLSRNAVNPVRFVKGVAKRNRNIDVLFVGRLLENKGIIDLLKAVTPRMKVTIVGDGLVRSRILRQFNKQPNHTLLSNISDSELTVLYRQAKIFVCPSTAKEGVLTTMLEAAASGCAIVTTNCCGMIDFAVNNKTAMLVPPNRPLLLSKVIKTLLTEDVSRKRIADAGTREIQRSWTWKLRANQLEKLYAKVCR